VRRKGRGKEEKQKEGGREDGRQGKREREKGGARRRSKKRTMPPSPARLEVENFLIENYESYLLCRAREEGLPAGAVGGGGKGGKDRGGETQKDKGRRMKLSGTRAQSSA